MKPCAIELNSQCLASSLINVADFVNSWFGCVLINVTGTIHRHRSVDLANGDTKDDEHCYYNARGCILLY